MSNVNMLKMSFFNNSLDKQELIKFVETTTKPIEYTYGLGYRSPTTHNKPISKDEAIKIIQREGLLDADEYENRLHLNAYSGNDMW